MNSREKLFFRNVKLYKSMSYKKREEEEKVSNMKTEFRNKQRERIAAREKVKKRNSFLNRLYYLLFS